MTATIWHDMFYLGLPLAEKILRPVLVYGFLVVALKLTGKRELAQSHSVWRLCAHFWRESG